MENDNRQAKAESELMSADPLEILDNILKTYQLEIKFMKDESILLDKLLLKTMNHIDLVLGDNSAASVNFRKEYAEIQAWRLKNSVVLMKEVSSLPASSTQDSLPGLAVALEENRSVLAGRTPSIPGASAIIQNMAGVPKSKSSTTTNPGARKQGISNFLKSLIASSQRYLEKLRGTGK